MRSNGDAPLLHEQIRAHIDEINRLRVEVDSARGRANDEADRAVAAVKALRVAQKRITELEAQIRRDNEDGISFVTRTKT